MVIEEQPAKIVEALRLFLQGNGFGMLLTMFIFFHIIKRYLIIRLSIDLDYIKLFLLWKRSVNNDIIFLQLSSCPGNRPAHLQKVLFFESYIVCEKPAKFKRFL